MRIFLLSPKTRLYYADRDHWVSHPLQARDFQEDVQVAIQRCLEEELMPVELVFCYDDPPRTFNMLLRAKPDSKITRGVVELSSELENDCPHNQTQDAPAPQEIGRLANWAGELPRVTGSEVQPLPLALW